MHISKTTMTAIALGLLTTASFAQPSYTSTVIPSPVDFKITAMLNPNPQPPGDPAPAAKPIRIIHGLRWISDDGTRGFGTGVVTNDQGAQLTVCFTYQDGTYTVIPTPGVNCAVSGGNNNGDFIGALQTPGDLSTHGFLYQNGEFKLFDSLLPQVFANPNPIVSTAPAAINANGQVVGTTFTTGSVSSPISGVPASELLMYAWLYSNGQITRVADFGGNYNMGAALNNNGDVVGFSSLRGTAPYRVRPTLEPSTGGVVDLGGADNSQAALINSQGQIVLYSQQADRKMQPSLYENGVTTPIQISGGTVITAASLNEAGEIVGSYSVNGGSGAPYYFKNGQATDLASLVSNLPAGMAIVEARQINNQGQILAIAVPSSDLVNGEPTTLLLTPAAAQTGNGQ